ncbi:MAG: hypothetical protein GX330_04215 [Bacteroidales bacterium]|nr:hypothetical protein [Bacteroidales bacterium]
MKWSKGVLGALVLVLMFGIVGNMEYRQLKREEDWQKSKQAIELEQEKIANDIIELQGKYEYLREDNISQGLWINNIRERLHMEFFEDLEAGVDW